MSFHTIDTNDKNAIIKIIEIFYPNAKIYLFGSYARGDMIRGSDIDIAIDNGEQLDIYTPSRIQEMIGILPMSQKVDIVDFNNVPLYMKNNILKDMVVWKN